MATNYNPDGYEVGVDAAPPGGQTVPPTTSETLKAPGDQTWKGDTSGASPVKVNTDALDWFVTQLRAVAPTNGSGFIKDTADVVSKVDVKPGTFGHAVALKGAIDGDKGLKIDTTKFLTGVGDALIMLGDTLAQMSKSYKDTEDDTKFTSEDLGEKMKGAFSAIDAFKSGGASSYDDNTPAPTGDGSQTGHTVTTPPPDDTNYAPAS